MFEYTGSEGWMVQEPITCVLIVFEVGINVMEIDTSPLLTETVPEEGVGPNPKSDDTE